MTDILQATGEENFLFLSVYARNAYCRDFSLERIHSYINVEQEPKPTEQGIPPAYWPASGDLRVEKLSARYSLVCHVSILETRRH